MPETQYARSGRINIAYQVLGEGPPDLIFVPGFVTNLELGWDWPPLAAFHRALATFSRLVIFDKRGTGLSDRVKKMPTITQRMDDLRAVMEAVGSKRAVIAGVSEGAPMAVAFAAEYPEKTASLILYAPIAKATRSDDYPWAQTASWWDEVGERFERIWGSPEYMHADAEWRAPSASGDPAFERWWAAYRRMGASPGAAAELVRMNATIDIRSLLPRISAPTLVLARKHDRVIGVEHARYVTAHIPGAKYLELEGEDHLPFVGDAMAVIQAIASVVGASADDIDLAQLAAEHAQDEDFDEDLLTQLTPREQEVLSWIARGKATKEIATAMYVSESTVRKHLEHIFEKLEVTSRTAAIARLTGRA